MYEVAVTESFSASHAIMGEEPHVHTFRVEVAVSGAHLREGAILVDFRTLRGRLKKVTESLEGKNLLEQDFWGEGYPSTEAISAYIYREMKGSVEDGGLKLLRVTVWEGESARVTYYE